MQEYDREAAVAYARRWAFSRNPRYHDFDGLGGDCTNFASQCLYAGSGVMNYTPTYGWYYISLNQRSPSWAGVPYLNDFLVTNRGPGPFAVQTALREAQPGDVLQLFNGQRFYHTLVVVGREDGVPTVAAHTYDVFQRPLWEYDFVDVRTLHIVGVRR